MEPKQKAKELIDRLNNCDWVTNDRVVRKAAIICVDNCIEINKWYRDKFHVLKESAQNRIEYWQQVKQEIIELK